MTHTTSSSLIAKIVEAWQAVTRYVATGHAHEFVGREKEKLILDRVRAEIQRSWPHVEIVGPHRQEAFGNWWIDLVCRDGPDVVAVEGKFKTLSDGAVPDNRKAAFFDLYKLEHYVASECYTAGLLLWLTNKPDYLRQASGDSADFTMHQGRVCSPGQALSARRARNSDMPLPLILSKGYVFNWQPVTSSMGWYSLVLKVEGDTHHQTGSLAITKDR